MGERPDVVLIAGPTASGKSALALEAARTFDGVVVNADSMQVYGALSILTARPGPDEMNGVEHRLYGHVGAARAYSVAEWLEDVSQALTEIRRLGRTAILVGGTGLYFAALENGLSAIPEIDPQVRETWRRRAKAQPQSLHDELARRDAQAAALLEPGDTQRLTRALEVFDATGRSIVEWQRDGRMQGPLGGLRVEKRLVEIDRAELHRRIERRFDAMISQGAIDEVRTLLDLGLPGDLPVMRAIGVPQLSGIVRGETDAREAVAMAKAATRQYAKRQVTWFRNQTGPDWVRQGFQNAGFGRN